MAKHKAVHNDSVVGKHSTVIDQAHDVLAFVSHLEGVKISPGIITQVKRSKGRAIKFTNTISGLEMKVLGNRSMQSFYIYTAHADDVIAKIEKAFLTK